VDAVTGLRWTEAQLAEWKARRDGKSLGAPCSGEMPDEVDAACETEADLGPESDLQRRCESYLDGRGFFCLHDRSRRANRPGLFLDVIAVLPAGRTIFFELKVKGRKPTREQAQTIARLLYLGHQVHVVKSFRRFVQIVEATVRQ